MKTNYILTLLLLLPFYSSAQNTTWSLLLNTNDDRNVSSIVIGENNNIYFSGLRRNVESYHYKGYVFKLDYYGKIIDSTFFDNHNYSIIPRRILPDTADGYILDIITFSTDNENNNCGFTLKRIDTNLNIIDSSKHFLFPSEYKYIETYFDYGNINNLLIYGYIFLPNLYPRMYIYETDLAFDSLNAKIYLDDGAILPMNLKQLNNNDFWIIDEVNPYYVLVDSSLNLISKNQAAIPHSMNGSYGVKWDTDTSFFLAADYFIDNHPTDHDIGFLHQNQPFDTSNYYFNSWGAQDTNDYPAFWGALDYKNKDSIFIGGTKSIDISHLHFSNIPSWYVLLQTDSMLNIRWEHFYGGDAYYNMTKLIATSDGGCIMAGTRFDYKEHPWVNERDIYIIKVNSEGLLTAIDNKAGSLVHDAIVYPNPGSEYLHVRVAVQHPKSLFKLYDMNGNVVMESIINGKTAQFNTTFLPPGTYVYSITGKNNLNEKGKWVKR